MAARELIEQENVLSLDKIKQLFNQFFRQGHKLPNEDSIETWLLHRDSKMRLFGITKTAYRALPAQAKSKSKKDAIAHFTDHFGALFQRRHDCIHNCDRPKVALQTISDAKVGKCVQDVCFLVERCQESLLAEFPEYLRGLGFSGVTRNRVGA
jgi:hypothetical protein